MNSDEPLTKEEIRNWRWKNFGRGVKLTLWAIPVGIGVGLATTLLTFTSIWIGVPPDIARAMGAPLLVPFIVAPVIWLMFRKQDRHEVTHERLMRQYMDRYQRRWRIFEVVYVLILAANAYFVTARMDTFLSNPARSTNPFLYMVMVGVLATVAWKGPAFMRPAIYKGLNDELAKNMRRQSLVIGYLFLVALLCVAFGVTLFRPELAPSIMAWLMLIGVSVPILSYAFLEWKASRS